MYFALQGVNLLVAPNPASLGEGDRWIYHLAGQVGPIPGAVFTLGVPLLIWYGLKRIPFRGLLYAAGMDPLAFRLKNLRDQRMVGVLRAATEKFGWDARKKRPHVGFGLAAGVEKGGYTAVCAEIQINDRAIAIQRLTVAFECGAIVNPDGLDHQVSGAIVQGLGGALFEAIDYEDGKLVNGRFSAYRVPRFGDVPPIDVVLVNRLDLPPAGAGETPIVGLAPALGNAIFDATGVRLRSLPLIPRGLPGSTSQALRLHREIHACGGFY
jgi:hypothetical protein